MAIVPWSRPRGAIHDLLYASSLGCSPSRILCVSERTLYLLQNFAAADVAFTSRYAVELLPDGYISVDVGHPLYVAYQEAVNGVQLEIIDMSCDITQSLEELRQQLEDCCLANQGLMAALISATNNQSVSDYLVDNPYYDPPSQNLDPPPEMVEFCQRCWSWALAWAEANVEAHSQALIIGQGGLGILMVIFAFVSLPLSVLVGIAAIIITIALEIDNATYKAVLDEAVPDLTCAIYTAGSSGAAVNAARAVIQDLDLNARTRNMLASQVCNTGMDGIFAGTFPISPSAPSDCSMCVFGEGYAYLAKGRAGGHATTGHCFRLVAGEHYYMEGPADGICATFRYNKTGVVCNAVDQRFRLMFDLGSPISGTREFFLRSRKPTGTLFAISKILLATDDPALWELAYTTGDFTGWVGAQAAVEDFLDIGTTLEWRLAASMASFQTPTTARYWCLSSDVPSPDGWTEGAVWECDAIRVDVS